jgi:hypothetical protein
MSTVAEPATAKSLPASVPARVAAPTGAVLELHLGELRQLFNSMDPAPFSERDLDPKATEYIVDWATEAPADEALALVVHLGSLTPDAAMLGDAVRDYFQGRAVAKRRELSKLFKVGRISLVIGLAFRAVAIVAGEALAGLLSKEGYAWLVKESLIIGGWVALWRPLEIFLYDWWPLRAQAKLFDRPGRMQVSVT